MALVDGQRNFRSHYYEKVGFRGVEEKKSLDLFLGRSQLISQEFKTSASDFHCRAFTEFRCGSFVLGFFLATPLPQNMFGSSERSSTRRVREPSSSHENSVPAPVQRYEQLWCGCWKPGG